MRLISVESDELTIGEPLPWALYDHQRQLIMDQGEVINSVSRLRSILEAGAMREPTPPPSPSPVAASNSFQAVPNNIPNSFQAAPKPPASAPSLEEAPKGSDGTFTFLDMKLRIGDRIQLQLPASMGSERHVVKLIGYVENASVLVTPPMVGSMSLPVRASDKIVARVFTSQTAFAFDSTIERVCKIPYDYLHLLYPTVVQGAIVRSAPRIKTRIITSISKSSASAGEEKLSGVIVNISAQGALICMRQVLAIHSQPIIVSFRINLHEVATDLNIKAVIRNVQTDENKDDSDPMKYQHGVQFLGMLPTDNMILQSLIYQQMVEQPHNLM
jgi:c-di-GMP-binding flagellar brake protein YcgR